MITKINQIAPTNTNCRSEYFIIWIILLPSFITMSNGYSQPKTEKQIAVGTGVAYYALKDNLISPLTSRGTCFPLQVFFRAFGEENFHHFQIQYASTTLHSPSVSKMTTSNEGGYLQYAYHRSVAVMHKRIQLYGGAVLDFQGSRRDNRRDGLSIGNNKKGGLFGSLNPSLLLLRKAGKDMTMIQAWTSLIAFTYGPGYALSVQQKTNWHGMRAFAKFECRISYSKYLSNRLDGRFDYQLQFYRLNQYEGLGSLTHQAILSLVYKIQ